MAFNVSDPVDVFLGTQWCPGVVDEIAANGCYWVMLDNPAPTLAALGKTHKHVDTSKVVGRRVLVLEAPNNFAGEEVIRSQ